VVTLLLVAHSDRRGRKVTIILPLVGGLVYFLSFLAVSYFRLSVYFLLGASLASSLFGGVGTFLGGCFAYVADRCAGDDERHKTLRMATVDMVIGLVSGVASLSTGYFLQATGFEGPILTAAGCQALSLLYAVFVLEETVKRPPPDAGAAAARPSCGRPVWRTVRGIYRMLAGAGCGGGGRVRLLPLGLAVQEAEEGRQHGDVGRLRPAPSAVRGRSNVIGGLRTPVWRCVGGRGLYRWLLPLPTDSLSLSLNSQPCDLKGRGRKGKGKEEEERLPVCALLEEVVDLQQQEGPAVGPVLQRRDVGMGAAPADTGTTTKPNEWFTEKAQPTVRSLHPLPFYHRYRQGSHTFLKGNLLFHQV